MLKSNPQIFMVTSSVGGGKTTFVKTLAEDFKKKGWRAGGFLTLNTGRTKRSTTYTLYSVSDGDDIFMIDTTYHDNWLPFRRFYFNPLAFGFGKALLHEEKVKKTDFLIIDEVGPMELQEKGWHESLIYLINTYKKPMVWVVREILLDQVQEFYHFNAIDIFDVKNIYSMTSCASQIEACRM